MGSEIDESVRALLVGDLQEYPQRTQSLDEQGWNAFGELVGAAFQRAVAERFGSAQDRAIQGFVADACAVYADTPVAADPVSAEALVRSALGDDADVAAVLERYDEPDLSRIELVLLRKLISDADLTGEAFDAFLAETGSEARPWSGQGSGHDSPRDADSEDSADNSPDNSADDSADDTSATAEDEPVQADAGDRDAAQPDATTQGAAPAGELAPNAAPADPIPADTTQEVAAEADPADPADADQVDVARVDVARVDGDRVDLDAAEAADRADQTQDQPAGSAS